MPRKGNIVAAKYELDELIGEGSMGEVWRATHNTLGRPFAIKFLKAYGQAASRMEERFLQEARLAGSVQHRFVVGIVDHGVTEEGTPYMVMELLRGESLADRLTRAPALPVRELLTLAIQTLSGLEAVHRAGVIHRDLKPENVVLVAEADGVIPKLVDFGISRPAFGGGAQRLTQPGATVGTPAYMSPEQARGNEGLDARTDIYSMGVILYEALAGVLPYPQQELGPLLTAIATGGAMPLSQLRPGVGRRLSYIVERAMEVDPSKRYDSAREMGEELMAALARSSASLLCPLRDATASSSDAARAPNGDTPSPLLLPGHVHSTVRMLRHRPAARVALAVGAALAVTAGGYAVSGRWSTTRASEVASGVRSPAAVNASVLPIAAPATSPPAEAATSVDEAAATKPRPAPSVRPRTRPRAPDLFRTPGF